VIRRGIVPVVFLGIFHGGVKANFPNPFKWGAPLVATEYNIIL